MSAVVNGTSAEIEARLQQVEERLAVPTREQDEADKKTLRERLLGAQAAEKAAATKTVKTAERAIECYEADRNAALDALATIVPVLQAAERSYRNQKSAVAEARAVAPDRAPRAADETAVILSRRTGAEGRDLLLETRALIASRF
jgi:hypothetical protein